MPKLKIYTVPERRDSRVSHAVGDAAHYGPHAQGAFYVYATTKDEAYLRLRELRFPVRASHLRVATDRNDNVGRFAPYLATAGDVVTADRTAGRRLVRVPAGSTEPVVLGTWRYLDDPALPYSQRSTLDISTAQPETTEEPEGCGYSWDHALGEGVEADGVRVQVCRECDAEITTDTSTEGTPP